MSNSQINKSIFLAAPRDTVWAFLTEKDKLAQWFHPAEADLTLGENYTLLEGGDDKSPSKICWGQVLEMQAPRRLVYSFTIKPLAGAITEVVWELEEVLGGTKLTLTHNGIPEAMRATADAPVGDAALGLIMALDAGWDAHLLGLRTTLN